MGESIDTSEYSEVPNKPSESTTEEIENNCACIDSYALIQAPLSLPVATAIGDDEDLSEELPSFSLYVAFCLYKRAELVDMSVFQRTPWKGRTSHSWTWQQLEEKYNLQI